MEQASGTSAVSSSYTANILELSKEAADLRQKAGVPQSVVGEVLGFRQSEISHLERGRVSLDTLKAYVELLREADPKELRKRYESRTNKAEERREAKKAKPPAPIKTAISREIKSFLLRHKMTAREFADMCRVGSWAVSTVLKGTTVPPADKVELYRSAMRKYEGENTPKSEQFKPKAEPKKAETPAAPPPPTAPKAKPDMKLVVENGTRINNGDNIAPLLKLDGKTMHVFTLVPGGVFVSYVTAEME